MLALEGFSHSARTDDDARGIAAQLAKYRRPFGKPLRIRRPHRHGT